MSTNNNKARKSIESSIKAHVVNYLDVSYKANEESLTILDELCAMSKNLFFKVKDNLGTAIVIPTVLGGLIQLIELGSINTSYIRFFSANQLIPDGLIAVLILILASIIFTIYKKLFSKNLNLLNLTNFVNLPSYSMVIYFAVISLFFLGSIYYLYNYDTYMSIQDIPIILLAFNVAFLALVLHVKDVSFALSFYILRKYNTDKFIVEASRYYSFCIGLVLLIIFLLLSIKLVLTQLDSINQPYNLDNYANLEERIADDYNGIDKQGYELLYFNDLYTFVEIKKPDDKEKKVAIYKTEDVLF